MPANVIRLGYVRGHSPAAVLVKVTGFLRDGN